MFYTQFLSPLGQIILIANQDSLLELRIEGEKKFQKDLEKYIQNDNLPIFQQARTKLSEYFNQERKSFDINFELKGTEFQKKVWNELIKIPFGQTISYREIAKNINNPKAVRAVGSAVGKNPIAIIIPCHRILGAKNTLCGYASGIDKKVKLLDLEKISYR